MQTSSFTVNDRATPSPVAHTFVPRDAQPGFAVFAEPGATMVGEKTFVVRWRTSPGRRHVRVTFAVPIVATETVNGVDMPKVQRMMLIDCNFRFDETTSEQERADAVGMFAQSLSGTNNVFNKTITGLEAIW